MRFYYSDQFTAESGKHSILIFVGGEWEISPNWLQAGLMVDLAEHRLDHAGLFYTEHRYYGKSRPTNDSSTLNLRYLTVDQALGDLAQFIQYIKSPQFENGKYSAASVGLVGCSYAGSMATWMRLAYPHLVDAVFSDSGPVYAKEDFYEYLEVINDVMVSESGQQCVDVVQESMEIVMELLTTSEGRQHISTLFNTCSVLTEDPLDVASFFWYGITESFAYLVQYARPGDVAAACAALTNYAQTPDVLERFAGWVRANMYGHESCLETRHAQHVQRYTNTDFDSEHSVMRMWTYQTCVEYGWYQTTSSASQPFLGAVPLEYFHRICQDFFPEIFSEEVLRAGVARTNALFAGWAHAPDRVVAAAGGADPWQPMCPQPAHQRPPLAHVHFIPAVSHCRAVSSLSSTEAEEELHGVQLKVIEQMDLWLMMKDGAAAAANSALLGAALLALLHIAQ